MKNFKKVLALVLVVATLLSFATVAGAVDTTSIYADADSVKYVEAVDVLTAIGVLNGKGASYKPNDTLKRSEAAKIIAMFDNGDTEISSLYNPANSFVDVADNYWAISYIAYCAKQGIISGVGNSKFAPESKLTGIQFLKMVLVTLGYDAKEEGFTGTSWKANVLKLALSTGLTDVLGKKYDYEAELTRDAAAQIMLNALNAKTVSYGQEVKNSGKKTVLTVAGAVENDSYLYESWDLSKKENITDDFGRPAHSWKLGKEEIGTYADAALATYTVAVEKADVLDDADLDEDVKLDTWTDGVKGSKTQLNYSSDEIGGQGVLTEVYEDRIVFVNTYLAKVTKVVEEKTDSRGRVTRKACTTLDVYTSASATSKTFESADFAKDDVVLVTMANGTVKTVVLADSTIAEFTKVKKVDGTVTQYALDGEFNELAEKLFFSSTIVGSESAALGNDVVAYFDSYGNIIGIEEYYAALNYAVIDAMWVEVAGGKGTIHANLVNVAGEMLEDVVVESVTLKVSTAVTTYEANDIIGSASWSDYQWAISSSITPFYDNLMSYTTNDDGEYVLTMNDSWNAAYEAVATESSLSFKADSSYVKDSSGTVKFQMTGETVVLVEKIDEDQPFAEYNSYTGFDSIPTMTGDVQYVLDKDTGKVAVAYVYNVSTTGTETTVFYTGDYEYVGKEDGKFKFEFQAYVLGEDGKLTQADFVAYDASSATAMDSIATGFYTIFVDEDNALDNLMTSGTFAADSLNEETVASKADITGNYFEVTTSDVSNAQFDGGAADIVAYELDGKEITDGDYTDLANGNKVYAYITDDGLWTVVRVSNAADMTVVDTDGHKYTGVTLSEDQIVDETWKGMVIGNLPTGYEVTSVTTGATGTENTVSNYTGDDSSVTVGAKVIITINKTAAYTNTQITGTTWTGAVNVTNTAGSEVISIGGINYTAGELLNEIIANLANADATAKIYSSANVEASSTDPVYSGFYVVVTAADGETTATYAIA